MHTVSKLDIHIDSKEACFNKDITQQCDNKQMNAGHGNLTCHWLGK